MLIKKTIMKIITNKKIKKKISELKLVILAGGLGSRLSEETIVKPKPLVEIGGDPIILHLMKYYSYFGVKKFIICLGYKGYMIREYFINRYLKKKNLIISSKKNSMIDLNFKKDEDWEIKFIETGKNSLTGKRMKMIEKHIEGDDFMFTYGDGLSDIPIDKILVNFYKKKCIGMLSAVKIDPKFGIIKFKNNRDNLVNSFEEKQSKEETWINAGFGVFNKKIFNYINAKENVAFEKRPLSKLAKDNQLRTFKHYGNWKCMDTLRDKLEFEELFKSKPFWITKNYKKNI